MAHSNSKPSSGGYESAVDNVKDIFGALATELNAPSSNIATLVDQSKANFDKLVSAVIVVYYAFGNLRYS